MKKRYQKANLWNSKKGMEMWQLVLIILAVLLLLFALGWYYSLSQSGTSMLDKVNNLL